MVTIQLSVVWTALGEQFLTLSDVEISEKVCMVCGPARNSGSFPAWGFSAISFATDILIVTPVQK
jgi:hypothetical protein